jgi:hypothetical protein
MAISLEIRKRLDPPIVILMANTLYASVATNQGIKSRNVLKVRRELVPTLVQLKETLW